MYKKTYNNRNNNKSLKTTEMQEGKFLFHFYLFRKKLKLIALVCNINHRHISFMFQSHRFLDEYYSQFDDRVSQSHVDNSNARMDPYATDYEQETISDQQVMYLFGN